MSLSLQLENIKCNEKSVLTMAFHPDVQTSAAAKIKLANATPGSFLTFSANGNNYCAVVDPSGEISINPFRWDVSGVWFNGGADPLATEMDLLDHLVKGQEPIPFFCDSL
jgi:hypothetical protein